MLQFPLLQWQLSLQLDMSQFPLVLFFLHIGSLPDLIGSTSFVSLCLFQVFLDSKSKDTKIISRIVVIRSLPHLSIEDAWHVCLLRCCYLFFDSNCDNGQRPATTLRSISTLHPTTTSSDNHYHYHYNTTKMTTNIGAQAADAVNEKLVERQKLEQEMLAHHQDLQTLISQRNENEMVKEVRKSWLACIRVTSLTA